MRCEGCKGFGRVPVYAQHTIMVHQTPVVVPAEAYRLEPCQECSGSGVTSCCGDACPEPEKEDHDR